MTETTLIDVQDLVKKFGEKACTELTERILYSHDISTLPEPLFKENKFIPDAVIQPVSKEDVIEIVKYAANKGLTIVPRGKGTGGYGGAIPANGGIVIDFSRMNKIIEIGNDYVVVEPGVIWGELERELNMRGKSLRIYPTSALSSTVGGWVAQGGYGVGSYEFGGIGDNIIEVEIVDGNGELKKVNVDDVVGACGITGLIVEVKIKIKNLENYKLAAYHFQDTKELVNFLKSINGDIYHIGIANGNFERSKKELKEKFILAHAFKHDKSIKEEEPEVPKEGYIAFLAYRSEISSKHGKKLDDEIAKYLWDERFYTMRMKRLGPGLVASEVIIDIPYLEKVLDELNDWTIEGTVIKGGKVVLLAMQSADERKKEYAMKYVDALKLLKIAKKYGGRAYSTGMYFAEFAEEILGKERLERIYEAKKRLDPKWILNPGKVLPSKFDKYSAAKNLSKTIKMAYSVGGLAKLAARPVLKDSRLRNSSLPITLQYDSFACAQCGFCEAVCTVYDAVKWPSASPRGKFYLIKQYLLGNYELEQRALDMFYLCTTCKKCELVCQTAIPIVNHWLEMRIPMTAKGYELSSLKQIRENVLTKGNFWGVDPKERWSWLPEKYKEKKNGKVAFWASCWESVIARNMPQNMMKILEAANVDFIMFGEDQKCCGLYFFLGGYIEDFKKMMEYNINLFKSRGVKKIIVHCPGCLAAFGHAYPEFAKLFGLDWDFEVQHILEVLSELIENGKLRFEKSINATVTIHDSCHTGRWAGLYEAPRKILNGIPGVKITEMKHNRENSLCCGAVAMLSNPKIGLSIALKRVNEAVDANADMIVTNCSGCLSALTFASNYSSIGLKIRDITDLIMEAMGLQPEKTEERIINFMNSAAKMLEGSRVLQGDKPRLEL